MAVTGSSAVFTPAVVSGCTCDKFTGSVTQSGNSISISGSTSVGVYSASQSGKSLIVSATINGQTCAATFTCAAGCTGLFYMPDTTTCTTGSYKSSDVCLACPAFSVCTSPTSYTCNTGYQKSSIGGCEVEKKSSDGSHLMVAGSLISVAMIPIVFGM